MTETDSSTASKQLIAACKYSEAKSLACWIPLPLRIRCKALSISSASENSSPIKLINPVSSGSENKTGAVRLPCFKSEPAGLA